LARVVADPKALMDSHYIDVLAVNTDTGSFPMVYSDLGNSFLLSAAGSSWSSKLPKWKFMVNEGLFDDDAFDPDRGVTINKYSSWVAAAVNLRIIAIDDLTDLLDTSFASAYAVVEEEDDAASDDGNSVDSSTGGEEEGSVYTAASEGASCKIADYFGDGFCE